MDLIDSYDKAITIRQKTPEDVETEMHEPKRANFAVFSYTMPSGVVCGVGKSMVPNHPSLFQIRVFDYADKPATKVADAYSGEYTSADRAEKALRQYTREAWEKGEELMTKKVRKAHAEKVEKSAPKRAD